MVTIFITAAFVAMWLITRKIDDNNFESDQDDSDSDYPGGNDMAV